MLSKKTERWREKCKYLVPNAHTLEQVVDYITKKYEAKKVSERNISYIEQSCYIRSGLILKERPDLVNTPKPTRPNKQQTSNPEFMSNYFHQLELRLKEAEEVEERLFPIDLEQYVIALEQEAVNIELYINLEYEFGLLSVTHQCSPTIKKDSETLATLADRIEKDIYHYYGVTKEDIETQSDRCRKYIYIVG